MTAFDLPILANAGTPLMWAGMFHLLFGNAIIGVGEGLLIAWLFRARKWRMILAMVAANYLSMFIAVTLLEWRGIPMRPFFDNATLNNAASVLWCATFLALLASMIIEWPFCWSGIGRMDRRWTKSIGATIVAQLASYAVLVPWYASVGSVSVLTRVKNTSVAEFSKQHDVFVYYIARATGDIHRIRGDGSDDTLIIEADFEDHNTRLYCLANSNGADPQLFARWRNKPEHVSLVDSHFAIDPAGICAAPDSRETQRNTWMSFGRAKDLSTNSEATSVGEVTSNGIEASDEPHNWEIYLGFWQGEGLDAEDKTRGKRIRLALETPFMAWASRNATLLPHDQVIYQLDDQIVLLDLEARKIGLLARGVGPLVVPERAMHAVAGESQPLR